MRGLTTAAEMVCVAPQLIAAAPTRANVEGTTPQDSTLTARTSPIKRPTVAPITCAMKNGGGGVSKNGGTI